MSLRDLFLLSWQGVRTRPLRSSLAALSLLIGVVTVVLVQGASEVIANATVHRALLSGGPATTVTVNLQAAPGDETPNARWRELLDRAVGGKGGHAVSTSTYGSATLITRTGPLDVDLVTVSPNIRSLRPFDLRSGRWFTDTPQLAPEIVLNRAAASSIRGWDEPASLSAGEAHHRLKVRLQGAVDDGIDAPVAYLRESDWVLLKRAGLEPSLRSLHLAVPGEDEHQLRARISTLAAVSDEQRLVADVHRSDQMSQFGDQLATSRTLLMTIAGLSLLVGALGILNVGLATLRDRAEEWALRRALGASRRHVLAMVLLESQLVAVTAALLALLVAWLAVPWALTEMSSVEVGPTPLPWRAALVGMAASSTAAFLGAVAPAVKTVRTALSSLLR